MSRRSGLPTKYVPLQRHLAAMSGAEVTLTFVEIEALIGEALPPTAYARTWWANVMTHPHARAWLKAGWRVAYRGVDFQARTVLFERPSALPDSTA